MEPFLLPAATYEPPSRQVRLKLNTIMEAFGTEREERGRSRSPGSPAPSSTSTISSYYKNRRASREFDDLYDVSESESEQASPLFSEGESKHTSIDSTASSSLKRSSWGPKRRQYPSIVIPSPRNWPTIDNYKKSTPVPPTPPPKILISPEVLTKLNTAPASSGPPSLDGSLTSDQAAVSSAPPTPDQFYDPAKVTNWGHISIAGSVSDYSDSGSVAQIDVRTEDAGIQLPNEALDILQHLSLDRPAEPHASATDVSSNEMQEISCKLHQEHEELEPASAASEYSISQLSIPSPGGFFSNLEADSRQTWSSLAPIADMPPPSSTTAEHFYNAPWNQPVPPPKIVEQVIGVEGSLTEGPRTAMFVPFSPAAISGNGSEQPGSSLTAIPTNELNMSKQIEVLKALDNELNFSTDMIFDRTTTWLAAQTSYLAALRETNPSNTANSNNVDPIKLIGEESVDQSPKKAVRFLDTEMAKAAEKAVSSPTTRSDSIFYQAFQTMSNQSSPTDSFIHRQSRFDALQAQRVSLQSNHIDSLLGYYETSDPAERPAPQRPISMMPGKNDDEETEEQRIITQVERERQALEKVTPAMWVVEAMRFLAGGRLMNSPAAIVLSRAPPLETCTLPEHVRVLDLGGQPQCDWAWHCARDFPNVKTYTATSDARAVNPGVRGPSNHRLVRVGSLATLPFPDNHFDAISTRSLHAFLKNEKPLGGAADEYDACLHECLRVLKPGGYLEFFLLDAEILHAGPRGTAASVEFGFNLRARGYDAAPTKAWLGRVRRAGFVDIKRAWQFLPLGAAVEAARDPPETPPPHASVYEERIGELEAVQGPIGSTADVAQISGLVGSWLWEQWLLKLQMEMGKETGLVEGVGAVIEEAKGMGAGLRCMSGWARKAI